MHIRTHPHTFNTHKPQAFLISLSNVFLTLMRLLLSTSFQLHRHQELILQECEIGSSLHANMLTPFSCLLPFSSSPLVFSSCSHKDSFRQVKALRTRQRGEEKQKETCTEALQTKTQHMEPQARQNCVK